MPPGPPAFSVRRAWLPIGCLIAAGLVTAAIVYPRCLILEMADPSTGRRLFCAAMADGEEFDITFTHSVNRRPVQDTLRVTRDHLVIVRSRFDAFGAGMPEATTQDGRLEVAADGRLEWTVNRPMPEVVLRVGRVANHTLALKGRRLPLAELAPPGAPIAFRARTASPWSVWKGRCLR
jgi:hypothetical protein